MRRGGSKAESSWSSWNNGASMMMGRAGGKTCFVGGGRHAISAFGIRSGPTWTHGSTVYGMGERGVGRSVGAAGGCFGVVVPVGICYALRTRFLVIGISRFFGLR